jgi:hypothetical protein
MYIIETKVLKRSMGYRRLQVQVDLLLLADEFPFPQFLFRYVVHDDERKFLSREPDAVCPGYKAKAFFSGIRH